MASKLGRIGRWLGTLVLFAAVCAGCAVSGGSRKAPGGDEPYVLVLGIAQDGGYPQAACRRACCEPAWGDASRRRLVSCLAIVDPVSRERWLIDATPDFREQLHRLDGATGFAATPGRSELTGIFITHAHIGHYTGLAHLGREAIGDDGIPVYAMPRLRGFLTDHGPWSLLVSERYVVLRDLREGEAVRLNERISVTPLVVPHRDEFSETVGFRIQGPARSVLFIPDIDKWERWRMRVEDEIARVDVAYLDGTFFANGEIPGRDMAQIPHPFIEESMARFAALPAEVRARVRFIHLNHTNPALDAAGPAAGRVREAGFGLAVEGERSGLGTRSSTSIR